MKLSLLLLLLLSFDVYVANFLLNTIPCRVISNNLGQRKVKLHAFYDWITMIIIITIIYRPHPPGSISLFFHPVELLIPNFQAFFSPLGFEHVSTISSPSSLFQIDTYDNRSVFALKEVGKVVQSSAVNASATSYGQLMEFKKSTMTWAVVPGLEMFTIKNVAVGEKEVFVLKRGTNAYISTVNFVTGSLAKYGSQMLSILDLGECIVVDCCLQTRFDSP